MKSYREGGLVEGGEAVWWAIASVTRTWMLGMWAARVPLPVLATQETRAGWDGSRD